MNTHRLKTSPEGLRVASAQAREIFRLAHRHGITPETAADLYAQARGNWTLAGELAKAAQASYAGLPQDCRSDI